MSKDLEKEYKKTFNELAEKYSLSSIDDEETIFKIFDEFYKKHKTLSMFEKTSNQFFLNAIKKVKEKYKKSVHYLLNIEPSVKKEMDYSNFDLTGPEINIDDKEKKLQIYLKNMNININGPNCEEKLNEEIDILGQKYYNGLLNEKNFLEESNKHWENYKKKKNLKINEREEEQIKKKFLDIKLKEESLPNNDYLKFIKYLNAKKNYYYEQNIYTKNYSNDIIYKSNKTWSNIKLKGTEDSSFSIKPKELFNKKNLFNENFNNNNEPKEYGNNVVNDVKSNKIYKIFERDFDNFFNDSLDI